ncbi:metallophosphoesterase, partial [Clostridium saudiense]|nr:metallophosphoesterase [Clostridium saudiense]
MRKIKILHCSDIHFDTPFKDLTREVANNSREELLEVFKRIIDLAIEESVQVLFIAGDVFDNFTVNKST